MNNFDDSWQLLGVNSMPLTQSQELSIDNIVYHLKQALNSRRRFNVNVTSHVLNYGLPDLLNFNPQSESECQNFRQVLQNYISYQEPRLRQIEVELLPAQKEAPFKLHFRVIAFLKDFKPEQLIKLESVLNFENLKFNLRQETVYE